MMEAEKECPFCGCNSIQVLTPKSKPQTSAHGRGYQVECINCGSRGPCGMIDEKAAIYVWNERV